MTCNFKRKHSRGEKHISVILSSVVCLVRKQDICSQMKQNRKSNFESVDDETCTVDPSQIITFFL